MWYLQLNGKYKIEGHDNDFSFNEIMDSSGCSVKSGDIKIHSVRRLSDNVVFSVGDKIFDGWEGEHSHFSGTVTGFEIYRIGMLIKYGEGSKSMHIANAAKQKLNK